MTVENLKSLSKHCLGTAESEEDFLTNVYISNKTFMEILEFPSRSPILLVGKKGSGKSAMLKELVNFSKLCGVGHLYLKPDDLPAFEEIGTQSDIATLKRKAYQALISAITIKVGETVRGFANRHQKKLVDKAMTEGARTEDVIQASAKLLVNLGSIFTSINFGSFIPKIGEQNTKLLEKALKENYKEPGKIFVLCFDDIDQVASPSERNHVNRIWAYLLAIKKIAEDLPNIKCVISLRSEIWNLIGRDSSGQRDQVDHFNRLVKRLDPSDEEIGKIITRRLEFVKDSILHLPGTEAFEPFFVGENVELPKSMETRRWIDFLIKSSRERPRDSLQFVHILCTAAVAKSKPRIDAGVAEFAMDEYSIERVKDLGREFESDCKQVTNVIDAFAGYDFRIDVERVKSLIGSLSSQFGITIRGRVCHPDNEPDLFFLWNFIHETGFLNPLVADIRQTKDFRHIKYSENPSFVSISNWNNMQKVLWEVHPAYRSHLLKIREDERARSGISLRKFSK